VHVDDSRGPADVTLSLRGWPHIRLDGKCQQHRDINREDDQKAEDRQAQKGATAVTLALSLLHCLTTSQDRAHPL
jgi:hypothetical protein